MNELEGLYELDGLPIPIYIIKMIISIYIKRRLSTLVFMLFDAVDLLPLRIKGYRGAIAKSRNAIRPEAEV